MIHSHTLPIHFTHPPTHPLPPKQYCALPSEAALLSSPEATPPPTWPQHGAIEAKNLEVAYRPVRLLPPTHQSII